MARPLKRRRICEMPQIIEFIPTTEPSPDPVVLTIDEYEVIRLIDYLGNTQEECAVRMDIARTTVQLIYDSARRKLATALVCARRLKIDGGAYRLCPESSTCCKKNCRRKRKETSSCGNSCGKGAALCKRNGNCQNPPSD